MIIECPVCPKPAPRYKIDASLIGEAGREVRCPRCGHEWFVTPDEVARQSAALRQNDALPNNPPPDAPPYAGFHSTPQQIVGMTFEAAPPYDEPSERPGTDIPPSAPPFAPQSVSAGAALAIAGASSNEDDAGAEAPGEQPGAPHVPMTAAEIASAFFASSFEEQEEHERQDEPDHSKTSFSLWAALDSVRPAEDEIPPPDSHPAAGGGAELQAEPRTAFHASPAQLHGDSGYEDPAVFDEANEYAELPEPEPDEDISRSEEYWGRTFHNAADAGIDEPPYGADSRQAGGGGQDEELKAALASAVSWSNTDSSSETVPCSPAPQAAADWTPPAESEDYNRLAQALKGHEADRSPSARYGEGVEEDHDAGYWPSEQHERDEDFLHSSGWRSAASSSSAEHEDLPPMADLPPMRDLPPTRGGYQAPEEETSSHTAPTFLRSHRGLYDDEPPSEPYHPYATPRRGGPIARRHGSDDLEPEAFPEEFDEALAAAQPRKMGGLAVAAAWGVFITIMGGLVGATIHFRENIAQRLPGTARLYQALNVPVAGPSRDSKLDFANVKYRWAMRDDQPMIAVEGDIVSRSNAAERIPALVVAIRDGERSLPQKRIENIQTEEVEANGTAHFTVDVTYPPKGVNEISIEFVK